MQIPPLPSFDACLQWTAAEAALVCATARWYAWQPKLFVLWCPAAVCAGPGDIAAESFAQLGQGPASATLALDCAGGTGSLCIGFFLALALGAIFLMIFGTHSPRNYCILGIQIGRNSNWLSSSIERRWIEIILIDFV